jgi:hypothetical protein
MSEMLERVARALVEGGHMGVSLGFTETRPNDFGSVPLLRARDTERALAAARAAIEAMREPTEAMMEALHDALDEEAFVPAINGNRDGALDRAIGKMIDAALTSPPAQAPEQQ